MKSVPIPKIATYYSQPSTNNKPPDSTIGGLDNGVARMEIIALPNGRTPCHSVEPFYLMLRSLVALCY